MQDREDDDACETSAIKVKNQQVKPSDQERASREALRSLPISPLRVVGAGVSDAHKRLYEEQHTIPVAGMDCGSVTDGQQQALASDGPVTKGATPFMVVNVKPIMTEHAWYSAKAWRIRQQ